MIMMIMMIIIIIINSSNSNQVGDSFLKEYLNPATISMLIYECSVAIHYILQDDRSEIELHVVGIKIKFPSYVVPVCILYLYATENPETLISGEGRKKRIQNFKVKY